MYTSISTWRQHSNKDKDQHGAQIDMIIERADSMIHLCEMKFSVKPYTLKQDYLDRIERRMWAFQEATDTRLSVVNTFVTTYGLTNPDCSHLVHSEVTMDDLFGS